MDTFSGVVSQNAAKLPIMPHRVKRFPSENGHFTQKLIHRAVNNSGALWLLGVRLRDFTA